jgi:RND family efflux transporter MFP subunit
MTKPPFPAYPRLLLMLALLPVFVACGPSEPPEPVRGERPHLVETARVVADDLSLVRTRTGTLRARHEVMIHTQEEGRLIDFPFYEGDRVKQGEVLVRIDDALIQAQLSRAAATRKQAEQDIRRLKELRARKLVSEDEYTRALTQLEVSQADEQLLRTRLGYTTIHSPLDGVVTARLSEPGNVVERMKHVLTVADLSTLVTTVEVSELVLPHLRIGDTARVRIDASGTRLAEKVEILSGLEEGQQVITKGFLGLNAGKVVKPVNPAGTGAS